MLDGLATANVTFNYVAINCLRVCSKPINEGHCQKMDVKIKITNLESTNHEDENVIIVITKCIYIIAWSIVYTVHVHQSRGRLYMECGLYSLAAGSL